MDSTGTPASRVSMFRSAMNMATVPPPPASTLPSSAICQTTSARSSTPRTYATSSAEASEAPDLPRAPVYLHRPMPQFTRALFRFSYTSAKLGS